jgi:7-cyano-7-deazaguanine reductase
MRHPQTPDVVYVGRIGIRKPNVFLRVTSCPSWLIVFWWLIVFRASTIRPRSLTRYNILMPKSPRYTPEHAAAGLDAAFPEIETWPNQFPGYEIVIDDPEFTSVCPKTGLPDFGVITLRYQPDKLCLELKSYKEYLHVYRNLGIFQENVVNRVLEDVVRWAKPVWAEVKGDFRPRGGISTTVIARWPRANRKK